MAASLAHIQPVLDDWGDIVAQFGLEDKAGPWRKNWAGAWIVLRSDDAATVEETAQLAAETMRKFIAITFPKIIAADLVTEPTQTQRLSASTGLSS